MLEDRSLKAAISVNHSSHQREHGEAIKNGLERHGIKTGFIQDNSPYEDADFHVVWSIKKLAVMDWRRRTGKPVLIMERGHVGDRMKYTSCGWNGLGHRGIYPKAVDGGERWRKQYSDLMRPWRKPGDYVLLIGQVPTDSALDGLKIGLNRWAQNVTNQLLAMGHKVVYRPHPWTIANGYDSRGPKGSSPSKGTLEEDLRSALICVTYNSTAGVESVLLGVSTITLDEGAMAWPVSSHALVDPITQPDREVWAHDLAWTQWTLEDMRSGYAWEYLKCVVETSGICTPLLG